MPRRASNRPGRATLAPHFPELGPPRVRSLDRWQGIAGRAQRETLDTRRDDDLLPRCRGGDEGAWRELVARHTRKVFGLAYRFTGRVDEAEDLTQEVFVKVYQTLERYREADGPFGAWLMAVARNHAIDHYRRGKQERLRRAEDPAILETTPARDEHPIAGLERRGAGAARPPRPAGPAPGPAPAAHPVRPAGAVRTTRSRPTLQVPLGTVKSRINRARLELAKRLLGRRRELDGDAS